MSETTWATVRLVLRGTGDREAMLELIDRLESVAMVLAERAEVSGVETRDPFTIAEGPDFRAVEVPELIAYTTPEQRGLVEQAAIEIAGQFALDVDVESAVHSGDDWRDAWKRYYRALRFASADGARTLMIRPSWIARAPGDPVDELVLDPGRAFGTGLHESTRLCLQALVELASSLAPRSALDLGCGSGILGLAALRVFPTLERVLLVDHDSEATETARENAELNQLQARIEAREVMLGGGPEGAWTDHPDGREPRKAEAVTGGSHSLVIANIRPSVLIPAASEIAALVTPGGTLILSGILVEEGDAVRNAYPGLAETARLRESDWVCLVLRAPP